MIINFRYRRGGTGKNIVLGLSHVMMIVYALLIFYPLFNMFVSSLKTSREIFQNPFGFPSIMHFENYKTVWIDRRFNIYFKNSLIVTCISMFFVILLGTMAAFGVSRYRYRLRTWVYMLFLSGIMLPLKAAIIPLFIIIKKLGLMDTYASVIFVFIAMGLPSTVFILSGFMKTIPVDLEHAASYRAYSGQ
jgi:raffinose/stachyose/melibiose transport system permease protein